MTTHAHPRELPVSRFNMVFLWPLFVEGPEGEDSPPGARLDRWEDWFKKGGPWSEAPDDAPYAERVYFHPFVRDFLYGHVHDRKERKPLRRLARSDLKGLRYQYTPYGSAPVVRTLDVLRAELVLFETSIAVALVELGLGPAPARLDLAEVMEVQDRLRRVYVPYWYDDGAPGRCMDTVEWLDAQGAVASASDFRLAQGAARSLLDEGREPPMADHWRHLIAPLAPAPGERVSGGLGARQVLDERVPFMSYLALPDPRALTRGDFARLALADDPGGSSSLPYSESALKELEREHAYDWFWEPKDDPDRGTGWMTTRHLCAGYAFVALGREDGGSYFTNDKNGALFAFRNHYLKMGLIAHFHRASLLMLSDRIARAAETDDKDRRRDLVRQVDEDVLRFRSRYWFHEVSNHLQGRTLFDLWARNLQTQRLFDQVIGESRTLNDVLEAEAQKRLATTTTQLTIVAAVGLAIGLLGDAISSDLSRAVAKFALIAVFLWTIHKLKVLDSLVGWFGKGRAVPGPDRGQSQ